MDELDFPMSNAPSLLSVNNYHYRRGGAEAIFLEHNRLFAERSWNVVPFSMRHPQNEASAWDGYFTEEIEFGSTYSIPDMLRKSAKAVYSFEARRKIRALIAAAAPDVCHVHNVYHHLTPAILPELRARGIPTFLTLHDLKIACPAYSMLCGGEVCERCRDGALYRVATRRCMKGSLALSLLVMIESYAHRVLGSYVDNVTRFVVPSRFYACKLAEWHFDTESFVHIPNFVDARRFAPRFEPGGRFVYVGRLSHEKGIATLLRAAADAGVGVDVIGTGPLERTLREHAAALAADVRFLGFLSGEALHDAIRAARAVVLPSEWYENAPLAVLEAYALGKPVLGAAIGGIPELVIEGETGALFSSGDAAELASRLAAFAALPDADVAAMGCAARRLAEADFSPERYVKRVQRLYAEFGVPAPALAEGTDDDRQIRISNT